MKSNANAKAPTALVISLSITNKQLYFALEKLSISLCEQALLKIMVSMRNSKTRAIYGKIETFARKFKMLRGKVISPRQVRRLINKLETAGYLRVEDQHNGKRQINSSFEITALVLDPTNEELKKQIIAEPIRKSRRKIGGKTRPNKRLDPQTLHPFFESKPVGHFWPTKSSPLIQEVNKSNIHTTNYNSLTVSQPPRVKESVVLEIGSSPIGKEEEVAEAEKVIEVYENHFPKVSQVTRMGFVRNFIRNKIPADKIIANIKSISADPTYGVTFSPNRLWEFESKVKPIRDMCLKRIESAFKSSYDPELAISILKDDKSFKTHFSHDERKMDAAIQFVWRQKEERWQEEQRREIVECPEFIECTDY